MTGRRLAAASASFAVVIALCWLTVRLVAEEPQPGTTRRLLESPGPVFVPVWTSVAERGDDSVDAPPPEARPEPELAATEPVPGTPCTDALDWVATTGLLLPTGVGYHCPSTQFAHHGAACWNGSPCRGDGFIAINMDLIGERGPWYLRHVVAHEICHILDFQATGRTTETGADDCATRHLAMGR